MGVDGGLSSSVVSFFSIELLLMLSGLFTLCRPPRGDSVGTAFIGFAVPFITLEV